MYNKLTQFLFSLLFLLTSYLAVAQTPPACPSSNTPAADLCPDMCIYCNLSEYTGQTPGYTGQTPVGGFCGTVEGEQWLGFVAGASAANISAIPSNCTDGNGIQIALYTSCTSSPVPGGCDMGFAGGAFYQPNVTVALTPGTTYYLMVDGWAGDQCDFTLSVSPPGAALSGQIIAEDVPICPGKTFFYEGVEYTAPGVVLDTLTSMGVCDSILVFNLVQAPLNTITQNVQLCPGESVFVNGLEFTEPGTYIYNITATSGGCDTIATYHFEYAPFPVRSDTIFLMPGNSVIIGGSPYTAPGTATEIVPATVGCDTVVTYVLLVDLSIPDTCLKTESFFKVLGQSDSHERSSVICAAADGNFYIAGEKEKKSLLMKVTPDGEVLWAHTFQPVAPLTTRITDLIEDSDGMLAGCGIVNPDTFSPEAYAFRFNPTTGNLMWSRYLKQAKPEAFAIVERFPGGNFFLLVSPQLTKNVDDAQIWELNRNNGTLASAVNNYAYGVSDVWNSMAVHDSSIYVIGRHIPGPIALPVPLDRTLVGVSKIDTMTGATVWSRRLHLDSTARTTLYGTDLLIHDNAILAVSTGFDSLGFSAKSAFFLQKISLDGELLWVKRYTAPGQQNAEAHDIQRVSDGYILTGQADLGSGNWGKIVLKTDFDGNVLWAKGMTSGIYFVPEEQYFLTNYQSVVADNVLYMTGFVENVTADIFLLKMTADGEVSDSCGFVQPFGVQAQNIVNLVNKPIQVPATPFIVASVNAPTPTALADMPVATYCVSCLLNCDDTLDLGPDIILCKDSTVTFNASGNFVSYLWQDGSTDSTFTTTEPNVYWVEVTNECGDKQRDSVLLTVSLVGDIKLADTTLCVGESLTVTVPDFDTYQWSPSAGLSCNNCATVTIQPNITTVYALFAETDEGCIKVDTFTVTVLPLQLRSELVEFCPGESVLIGGNVYTQPGTVVDTLPGAIGCDTIVTYTLQHITTPNSSVSIDCVGDINIASNPGTGPVAVNYDLPTVSSDCECPGISLTLTQGLSSGSLFPVGTTQVCYQAKDSCGNTASCCFKVIVREEQPCDTKIVGCMKWELLTITKNTQNQRTYRIRATNLCSNKLIYTAFQLPNGIVAVEPPNNSVYTAPSGREYDVRNPNYSPFYSIRFKSNADSIAAGQSDIFEYTLPVQAYPAYINVTARLYPKVFYSSHLTTILCPIGVTPEDKPAYERGQDFSNFENLTSLRVFPNPTSGTLFADLSDWQGEQLQLQIFNSQGQRVQHLTVQATDAPQEIQLPESLAAGLYFLEVLTENGEKQAARFVLQH